MANNLEGTANHYGQLFLLILVTIFCILGLIFYFDFGFILLLPFILTFLGVWQVIDFVTLWVKNGYKKWYNLYIGAILIFLLFVILIFSTALDYISFPESIKEYFYVHISYLNLFITLMCSLYTIIIAWIYLLYWRKK